MRYFTVDRSRTFSPGLVVNTSKNYSAINSADVDGLVLQQHIASLFPGGLSRHGQQYLEKNSQATVASPNIELIWEYVRRAHFPTAPSRFSSMFACASSAEAQQFAVSYGVGTIWEVESNAAFRADMAWLTLSGSILIVSTAANGYWAGDPVTNLIASRTPFWEYLVPLPATIGNRIA